jgi:hypothetical protein
LAAQKVLQQPMGIFVHWPFWHSCTEHQLLASQANEHAVPFEIAFFSKAQEPGGGGAAAVRLAAQVLLLAAIESPITAPVNSANFQTDVRDMVIPIQ